MSEDAADFAGDPDSFGRLWTPHRMVYIKGQDKPASDAAHDCPFCAGPGRSDEDALIVGRGEHVFVVLNLYPYNSGHAMTVLRDVMAPHGFNLGINQGHVAGAGIAAHLHQHVVPRWGGDTNFMPIVGETRVLPELLADARRDLARAWARTG